MTPTEIVSPPDTPSLAIILTMLGFGKNAAAIASLLVGIAMVIAHILPWLPVPDAGSGRVYTIVYGILSRMTGGYLNAKPVPESEKLPPLK